MFPSGAKEKLRAWKKAFLKALECKGDVSMREKMEKACTTSHFDDCWGEKESLPVWRGYAKEYLRLKY